VFVLLLRAGPGDFGFSSHGLRGVGAGNVSYLVRLRVCGTRAMSFKKQRGKICRLLAPSLSLVVIAGVVIVIVIVGVLAVILLAG
jgi:hypothetical protein